MIRQAWIDKEDEVSVVQQCASGGGISRHGLCAAKAQAGR